jgi:hypothetical protein
MESGRGCGWREGESEEGISVGCRESMVVVALGGGDCERWVVALDRESDDLSARGRSKP